LRTNEELKELCKIHDLVAVGRRKSLKWLGHIITTEQTVVVKKTYENKPEGRRQLENPN
jgi:hypothetical protein